MSAADVFAMVAALVASASAIATHVLARKTLAQSREDRIHILGDPAVALADHAEVAAEIEGILAGLSQRKMKYDGDTNVLSLVLLLALSVVTVGALYLGVGANYLFFIASALFVSASGYFCFVSVVAMRNRHFWAMRKGELLRLAYIANNYLHSFREARDMRALLLKSGFGGEQMIAFDNVLFDEFAKRDRED